MLISIMYFFSFFLLMITFLLIKKQNNKLNILKWIFITFILIFCFNSLIVYILSYIGIKSTLFTLSIVYICLSLFIIIFCLSKERQKYYFNKKDLFIVCIIFLVVLVISVIRFGFPFSIVYQTFDPAIHYQSSYSFYKYSYLLNFVHGETMLNFETWRFASYTNLGIVFKVFSCFMNENSFYNLYILFDIFTLFFTGVLFYFLIDNNKNKILKLIGCILFVCGYPLNNLMFGFFYVGHASCIIITIFLVINELDEKYMKNILLFILNIGLMFTYYLFVPVLYCTEFLYFIKKKKMIFKSALLFVIPLILGFIYFIYPTFSNNDMNLGNQIHLDGFFYNDVIGNALLFLPIASIYIYYKLKERKITFEMLAFIALVGFMIILNICMLLNIILPYYVSKYYYILWIFCFIILFRTFDDYYSHNKFMFKNYAIFMLLTIFLSISNIEKKIINLNDGEYNKTTPNMIFNVYNYNLKEFINPVIVFTDDELNEIKDVSKNLNIDFYTNTEPERIMWLINFINDGKLDCPANYTYECLKRNYYMDLNDYTSNHGINKDFIFFPRTIYWKELYSRDILNTAADLEKRKFSIESYNSFIVVRSN